LMQGRDAGTRAVRRVFETPRCVQLLVTRCLFPSGVNRFVPSALPVSISLVTSSSHIDSLLGPTCIVPPHLTACIALKDGGTGDTYISDARAGIAHRLVCICTFWHNCTSRALPNRNRRIIAPKRGEPPLFSRIQQIICHLTPCASLFLPPRIQTIRSYY
jgi:hypothetical protein